MGIELEMVIEALKYIALIVFGGLSIYLKVSPKAQTKAKQVQEVIADITAKAVIYIKEAEEAYIDVSHAGGQKFNYVVDELYALVPEGVRIIITREMIADIVQSTFEQIEGYVKIQLDKAMDSANKIEE